ncbi:MAG: septum site-determining protein MinC [Desulfocucumaceae bacterium]
MAGDAVSIKGTNNGLVIIFNPDTDLEDIKENLKLKMEKSKGFFRGAKYTFYNSNSKNSTYLVDELEVICRQYGLVPSGEALWPPEAGTEELFSPRKKEKQVIPIRKQSKSGEEDVVLVARTLRSGQRFKSHRSVIIMGDVNPGAEVISEKSIYVMGNCKGFIHAGCSDNLMAEVFALRLQPSVLRIGSISADAKAGDPVLPQVARVLKGKIEFSLFSNNM